MLSLATIRRRLAKPPAALLALALGVSVSAAAHASSIAGMTGCSASGDSMKCRLLAILNFLYAAAGLLGLLLIVVVVLAVRAYRKNKTGGQVDV